MIWKSLGVLLGAVTLIILGVVGLARVTVPDEPNFAEGLEEGGTDADTFLETLPIAVGGQLELSGAKEGTVVVDQNVNGPSYGLGNSKTRIFFEGSPLSVSQMSHDGLTFFPEPEDCEFTTGVQNEETGITAVKMCCPELVDIRGNGTLSRKMPMKAAAATSQSACPLSARLAIRNSASTTIASTAGFSPKKIACTKSVCW